MEMKTKYRIIIYRSNISQENNNYGNTPMEDFNREIINQENSSQGLRPGKIFTQKSNIQKYNFVEIQIMIPIIV